MHENEKEHSGIRLFKKYCRRNIAHVNNNTLTVTDRQYSSKHGHYTLPIRTNLAESKPKLNNGFTLWVYPGFTRVDQE